MDTSTSVKYQFGTSIKNRWAHHQMQNVIVAKHSVWSYANTQTDGSAFINSQSIVCASDSYRFLLKISNYLDRILPKLKATGHRAVLFYKMTESMPILENYPKWSLCETIQRTTKVFCIKTKKTNRRRMKYPMIKRSIRWIHVPKKNLNYLRTWILNGWRAIVDVLVWSIKMDCPKTTAHLILNGSNVTKN